MKMHRHGWFLRNNTKFIPWLPFAPTRANALTQNKYIRTCFVLPCLQLPESLVYESDCSKRLPQWNYMLFIHDL